MKNYERFEKSLKNETMNNIINYKSYKGDETRIVDLLMELVNKNYKQYIKFNTPYDFAVWCARDQFEMKQSISNALYFFDRTGFNYIIRDEETVEIRTEQRCEHPWWDKQDLMEMGFKYEDFDFLEEDVVYNITEIRENRIIIDED